MTSQLHKGRDTVKKTVEVIMKQRMVATIALAEAKLNEIISPKEIIIILINLANLKTQATEQALSSKNILSKEKYLDIESTNSSMKTAALEERGKNEKQSSSKLFLETKQNWRKQQTMIESKDDVHEFNVKKLKLP